MLHCNSRAKLYSNCKLCAGRFLVTFSRDEKVMRERLEENSSERLRLRTVVEYNGERKRLFLIHPPTFAGEPLLSALPLFFLMAWVKQKP